MSLQPEKTDEAQAGGSAQRAMTTGCIYIATGESFFREAVRSASSLKVHNPALPVTIFTDQAATAACFDQVIRVERSPAHFDHVQCMGRSPYERTLYLDCDTYVCGDLMDLFPLLERFDLAVAHDPLRHPLYSIEVLGEYSGKIPRAFFQHNAGVVLFRQSAQMQAFFADWLTFYRRDQNLKAERKYAERVGDQAAFREALWRNPVALWVLPPEYNCRPTSRGFLVDRVKILHVHLATGFSELAATLNALPRRRLFVFEHGRLTVTAQSGEKRLLRLIPRHRAWLMRLRKKFKLERPETSE